MVITTRPENTHKVDCAPAEAAVKASTLSKEDLENYELTHWRGEISSDGWAMVENIDPEYCRIAQVGGSRSKTIERRAYLAFKQFLTVSERRTNPKDETSPLAKVPISDDVKADLQALREAIKNGTMTINCTRIEQVNASQS